MLAPFSKDTHTNNTTERQLTTDNCATFIPESNLTLRLKRQVYTCEHIITRIISNLPRQTHIQKTYARSEKCYTVDVFETFTATVILADPVEITICIIITYGYWWWKDWFRFVSKKKRGPDTNQFRCSKHFELYKQSLTFVTRDANFGIRDYTCPDLPLSFNLFNVKNVSFFTSK